MMNNHSQSAEQQSLALDQRDPLALYRRNVYYTDFLDAQDPALFAKYIDHLTPDTIDGRVLDVGCGTGQVVAELRHRGVYAIGIEVSETSVERAQARGLTCILYDGHNIPFNDGYFDVVGAFNVLEHVPWAEELILELVRVLRTGGKLVISCPNFYRFIGWRDYHPRMRGLMNKFKNFIRLVQKWRQIRKDPDGMRFDRMVPVWKKPFEPDDDAVVATNPIELSFFVERAGCVVEKLECTDRYIPKLLDFLLNISVLRYGMFNVFLVARKVKQG